MIHYTCDRCQRPIQTDNEVRYEVRIDAQPLIENEQDIERDSDRDHLAEIEDLLESEALELEPTLAAEQELQDERFDLCSECYASFIKNPLGKDSQVQLGFSEN